MLIRLTIDRFEGDLAILKTADNQSINWPKDKLPAHAGEGAALLFLVSDDPKENKSSRDLAKEILNEILNPAKS